MRLFTTLVVLAVVGWGMNWLPADTSQAYPGYNLFLPVAMKNATEDGTSLPTATPTQIVAATATATSMPSSTPTPTQMAPTATSTATRTPTPTATATGGGIITWAMLDGNSWLLSADDTYIGLVSSNEFHANSITNEFGTYGSAFSASSIMNQFGVYGSLFSAKSAWNTLASSPPVIIYQDAAVAYLSENTMKSPRVDTSEFINWLRSR